MVFYRFKLYPFVKIRATKVLNLGVLKDKGMVPISCGCPHIPGITVTRKLHAGVTSKMSVLSSRQEVPTTQANLVADTCACFLQATCTGSCKNPGRE